MNTQPRTHPDPRDQTVCTWPGWLPVDDLARRVFNVDTDDAPSRAQLEAVRRACRRLADEGHLERGYSPEWCGSYWGRDRFVVRPLLTDDEQAAEAAYWKREDAKWQETLRWIASERARMGR